ncbi:hypothetical protein [Streptomyces sp. NPDC046859]|uniref:hypothetical protein n=1 Tax=Streptomyces sp. NPDC046859 TaxID=3155734 RepID=UPI0033D356C9
MITRVVTTRYDKRRQVYVGTGTAAVSEAADFSDGGSACGRSTAEERRCPGL